MAKKDIHTDNILTEIVVETQQIIHDLRKEVGGKYKVPFMHRELTKYEKSKRREENAERY